MFIPNIDKYKIILASESPRRHYLLKEIGIEFEIKLKEFVEESYPENLEREEIPLYLAQKKASVFDGDIEDDQLIITADTIVWLNDKVLQKPINIDEAIKIFQVIAIRYILVYV